MVRPQPTAEVCLAEDTVLNRAKKKLIDVIIDIIKICTLCTSVPQDITDSVNEWVFSIGHLLRVS